MGDDIYVTRDYNFGNLPQEPQMKHYRIYLAIIVLVLSSLACQAVMGGRNEQPTFPSVEPNTNPDVTQPVPTDSNDSNTDTTNSTDFPTTADAYDLTEVNGTLIFYTKLSLEDTMKFYRDEYSSRGYTERELLTVVSDGTFSMVFDGDPSGKAIVIQSVDLGDGSRTVTIRLEDV
jgi:hypothetical protein